MELTIDQLKKQSKEIRRLVLCAANRAGAGHVGGSLSEIDLLTALYFYVMRVDPANPLWPERDRLILSKGHASLGYYAALACRGYFCKELLDTFDQTDTLLQAHPDMHKCPGVDYSTGSLGQGLSVGIGMVLGATHVGRNFRTFVLLGDGESQEGQVWEALMYAGVHRVPNLIAIFDCNQVQLSSTLSDNTSLEPLTQKLSAFGWKTIETDGHQMESLLPALQLAAETCAHGPVAVVAHTIKGKGVQFMEGDFHWHGKAPNDRELALALSELEGGAAG